MSITSQWRLRDTAITFHRAEANYLKENAMGLAKDGEVETEEGRQSFKERIVVLPTILARRVEGREITLQLGTQWGMQLLEPYLLRNAVVHAPPDKPLARVTLLELTEAVMAVKAYFEELGRKAPETFNAQVTLLPAFEIPSEDAIKALIQAERDRGRQ